MQLIDVDDDDVNGERGGGRKGSAGGGRRERLTDVVFRQALRKFDQKVLLECVVKSVLCSKECTV